MPSFESSTRSRLARRPLVLLTDPLIPDVIRETLRPRARVRVLTAPSGSRRGRAELLREIRNADGLITCLSDRVDDELLGHAPRLRAVGNFAVGVDNIDLGACAARGIRVVNTPDVLTRATAELALALLLAASRRLPEGDALCRSGKFKGWTPRLLLGRGLQGRQAVLVGQGRIGSETARLFEAVGLRTEWITRKDSDAEIRRKLGRAEVLSLHVPFTPDTRHWLSRERIACLPREAIVINTSRGAVIEERALIQALRSGRIAAAGLDVFEKEPEIPTALRALPQVAMTPHLGSSTLETRRAMAELVVSGVLELLGQLPFSGSQGPWNEVKSSP